MRRKKLFQLCLLDYASGRELNQMRGFHVLDSEVHFLHLFCKDFLPHSSELIPAWKEEKYRYREFEVFILRTIIHTPTHWTWLTHLAYHSDSKNSCLIKA